MIRTFNYPLKPTKAEAEALLKILERCRVLYNAALEERRSYYKKFGKSRTLNEQYLELTKIREVLPEYGVIAAWILRSPLNRLDKAFKAFFRRVKNGEKPGFPRFKSFGNYDSFSFSEIAVERNYIRIPCFGWVRFKQYLPIEGTPKQAIIKFRAGKWTVSFQCDIGPAPEKVEPETGIGIDVGLTTFTTYSDNSHTPRERWLDRAQESLAVTQRILQRKQRGSANRKQVRRTLQKKHLRVQNQRKDFARKLAVLLFRLFDCVFYEDLNIKGLAQGFCRKGVYDVAWGYFLLCLTFKAEKAGKWAVGVNPRGTSQRCSRCQEVTKKDLSERMHRCSGCGLTIDRDLNAAINVEALGWSAVSRILGKPEILAKARGISNDSTAKPIDEKPEAIQTMMDRFTRFQIPFNLL